MLGSYLAKIYVDIGSVDLGRRLFHVKGWQLVLQYFWYFGGNVVILYPEVLPIMIVLLLAVRRPITLKHEIVDPSSPWTYMASSLLKSN